VFIDFHLHRCHSYLNKYIYGNEIFEAQNIIKIGFENLLGPWGRFSSQIFIGLKNKTVDFQTLIPTISMLR
jgi:hypothetical protein